MENTLVYLICAHLAIFGAGFVIGVFATAALCLFNEHD